MKYVFLELVNGRWYEASMKLRTQTRNHPLENLFEFLSNKESRWIQEEEDDNDPRKVFIWSEWDFKEQRSFREFKSTEDFIAYGDEYSKYTRKRWKELPTVHIFKDNLEFLEHQWTGIYTRKPKWLIFRQSDNGFVDILEKDELPAEDLAIMEREHKIYLNYIKRWEIYLKAHPDRNTTWYSSADDEYESDFALYDPIDEQGIDE